MAHTKAFPRAVEQFQDDERIAFDNTRGAYILEDFDGKEYEFNDKFSTWVEQMNDELVKAQQSAYYKADGDDDDKPDESVIDKNKKRKAELKAEAKENKKARRTTAADTSVYVSGLPLDATLDEIRDRFKRCGIFALNIDDETERIKLYANEDGSFKGEALITYFRPESVQMAIDMLDGTDLRTFMSGDMHVEKADMSYKKHKEYQADAPEKKPLRRNPEKVKRITQERNGRLADWSSDEEPQALLPEKPKNKHDKTVVVKHMFTLDEIKGNPDFVTELEEDITDEAKEKDWGDIVKIDVFDLEPEGVVRIRFRDPESAQKAMLGMDGRLFDGRQLVAYVPDRKEKWRKSARDEEEEERRLRKYGEELAREEL